MRKKLLIIGLFALMLLLPNTNVLADSFDIGVGDVEKQNDDGTAKWDASSKTLELNNYNGGEIYIGIEDDVKIVLKGTNVIDADGDFGIYSNSNLSISGEGTLKIVNSFVGIYLYETDLTVESGSIEIIGAGMVGIGFDYEEEIENGNVTINGGTVKVGASTFAISVNEFVVNGGSVYVKGDVIGIWAETLFEINGGYVESEAGVDDESIESETYFNDSGVAIVLNDTGSSKIVIGDNMIVTPNDISVQKVNDIPYGEEPMDVLVYGKDGIEVDLESFLFKNVASKVIIEEKETEPEKTEEIIQPEKKEESNPDTYDNIYNILLMLGISLGGLATIYRKKVNN